MPLFKYVAVSKDGKSVNGVLEAANLLAAGHTLKEQGLSPLNVAEQNGFDFKSYLESVGTSVPLKEKIIFIQDLALLMRSGVATPRALRIIAQQTSHKYLQKIVKEMAEAVESGKSLHESMGAYPKVFSHIFLSMVKVGELSGNLEKTLDYLKTQLTREAELKSRTKGAMMYPAIIISAMLIIGVLLAIFVLPNLTSTFKESGVELPIMTKIVIVISDFASNNKILVLISMVAVGALSAGAMKTKQGQIIFNTFLLNMPMINPIVKKINVARFTRVLSSLIKSGISVVEGLKITSSAMDNNFYRDSIAAAGEAVKVGKPLTESLSKNEKLYPFIVTQMLSIGEETGNMDTILEQIAEQYEAEVDDTMKNLSSIIEPLLLLVIGGVVGFLALALIMPIYNISQSVT